MLTLTFSQVVIDVVTGQIILIMPAVLAVETLIDFAVIGVTSGHLAVLVGDLWKEITRRKWRNNGELIIQWLINYSN